MRVEVTSTSTADPWEGVAGREGAKLQVVQRGIHLDHGLTAALNLDSLFGSPRRGQ